MEPIDGAHASQLCEESIRPGTSASRLAAESAGSSAVVVEEGTSGSLHNSERGGETLAPEEAPWASVPPHSEQLLGEAEVHQAPGSERAGDDMQLAVSELAPVQPQGPPRRHAGFGGRLCEVAVLEAVEEYLRYHGLTEALCSLCQEVEARGLRPAPNIEGEAPSGRIIGELGIGEAATSSLLGGELIVTGALDAFDTGQREAFFKFWDGLVPGADMRSPTCCALELRLRVHFCVVPARGASPDETLGNTETKSVPQVGALDFDDLKVFLAAHPAAALDESSETLAPLFALPFVPRPRQNPGLKFVFEEAWLSKLRVDLVSFLLAYAHVRHAPVLRHLAGGVIVANGPKTAPPPASWHELVRIADLGLVAASRAAKAAAGAGGSAVAADGSDHCIDWRAPSKGLKPTVDLLRDVMDARRRLAALARDPHLPPADPAAAMLPARSSVAGSADGGGTSLCGDAELPACAVGIGGTGPPMCPWPLSREAALRAGSASDLEARSPMSKRLHSARNLESRARTATALLPVPPALDFGRIAAVIAGEGDGDGQGILEEDTPSGKDIVAAEADREPSLKAVLRAVLRRLALPEEPIRPRRAFLAAFACFGALRTLAGRLSEVADSSDAELLELVLAVLAVCACEVVGRREIEAAEIERPFASCVAALVSVLRREPVTTLVHMQCLAALQRLSLRSQLQSKMIKLGAIDWILENLRSVGRREAECVRNSMGSGMNGCIATPDFSVEFASALLMNLTLRTTGKKKCSELGAYNVLIGLIEHPNAQVRTHVNGTLYGLLELPAIRADARRQGAEAAFRAALGRCPPGSDLLQRQLEYLLSQLNRAPADGGGEADGDGGDDDDSDAGGKGDVDDGDNFLDEEELAGHFLLAPAPGATGGGAAVESSAMIEAAAAEEALRRFRVTPVVAEMQQRRFHAFIARACRLGLISPKGPKRRISYPEGSLNDGMLVPTSPSLAGPAPELLPMHLPQSTRGEFPPPVPCIGSPLKGSDVNKSLEAALSPVSAGVASCAPIPALTAAGVDDFGGAPAADAVPAVLSGSIAASAEPKTKAECSAAMAARPPLAKAPPRGQGMSPPSHPQQTQGTLSAPTLEPSAAAAAPDGQRGRQRPSLREAVPQQPLAQAPARKQPASSASATPATVESRSSKVMLAAQALPRRQAVGSPSSPRRTAGEASQGSRRPPRAAAGHSGGSSASGATSAAPPVSAGPPNRNSAAKQPAPPSTLPAAVPPSASSTPSKGALPPLTTNLRGGAAVLVERQSAAGAAAPAESAKPRSRSEGPRGRSAASGSPSYDAGVVATKSDASRRAAAEAAAVMDAVVSAGESRSWRRKTSAVGRSSRSLDAGFRPCDSRSSPPNGAKTAPTKGGTGASSLPQLPKITG